MPAFCDGITRHHAIRVGVAALLLVATACVAAGADDPDPVKDKLFAAKVAYDKEMQEYRKSADEWFDKREETARKDGNKKMVDQIKGERKVFDEDGELPKVAPAAVQQRPALAKKALEVAYEQAVKDYIKAKMDDRAAVIETELKAMFSNKAAGAKIRPAEVTTKEDLQKYLSGTSWIWGDSFRFKPDGHVEVKDWDSRGLVTKWEAVDRRTVVLTIEKGRDSNRIAVLTFSEKLTEFTGYDFDGKNRIPPSKRKP